jgi:hypothetical protein
LRIPEIATKSNLHLAWQRISTGTNQQYKRYFRDLYNAYAIALDDNLGDLRSRLNGGSFKPGETQRLYLPKPTGLLRPITLLTVEDQIVLQAIANLVARRIQPRRKSVQMQYVFSNILQTPNSIFFVRDWRGTYRAFQKRIESHFRAGLRWVADFDLAAFYDTISHELLLRTAYPRLVTTPEVTHVLGWFASWASGAGRSTLNHGIPQGPLASDLLAECFLFPVDSRLAKSSVYVRYVDDIRLFGKSAEEVRRAVIALELLCRERGLIPQVGKFALHRATSVREALGMLPSITSPHEPETGPRLSTSDAVRLFRTSLDGRPQRIRDKTRARFVLYRAGPSPRLLKYALRLLPRHPEHVDAFVHFLSQYTANKRIARLVLEVHKMTPYEYVQGEMWHLLARMLRIDVLLSGSARGRLRDEAVDIAKSGKIGFAAKWGALHFLCALDSLGHGNYARFIRFQDSSLLQSFLVPVLPSRYLMDAKESAVVAQLLRRSAPEPGLMLAGPSVRHGKAPQDFGVSDQELPSQVTNAMGILGLTTTSAKKKKVDPLGEILRVRYGTPKVGTWRRLLQSEYVLALGLAAQADAVFLSSPSSWLISQNSFNHAVFLALQRYLAATGLPGQVATHNKHGELIDYGSTLHTGNSFSSAHPGIADVFRDMNARRNRLPLAHPYDKRTSGQNRYLATRERNKLVAGLRVAFGDIVGIVK